MAGDTSVDMMINVLPGTLTGIFALNAGLSSINQQFQNMTKAVDNHFGIIDAAIVSATALTVQFAKGAADAFGEYEQGMKIVQAVSGQSAAAISELGQKANEFSVQYRMDISELTDGLQTLGRAGLKSASEQAEVLENGLTTAKLEGRDLNSVLEELLQNTTLLGGNLKSENFGEQTEYVNDLLVATSMTAPINTHDVSETLKYSGGIAAAAGANIESEEGKDILEDYMGAIAAFAQKGVKGSIAGTALRAFFNKPATQDSSVLEGLSMIGLKPEYLWEDDQQTMKPISEQISLIQSQMEKKGISQMDKLQIWSKIVGGKMGQQMMKLDGSDIREVTKDIKEANSAENLATQSMQTYESAMKQASEAGQVAFRGFGEHVARFLTPIAKALSPILEALANPVISTAAFDAFILLLGRAYVSIKKIFTGLRTELGMIKSLFSSTVLNQPRRRAVVGGQLHGGGMVAGYEEEKAAVNQISTQVKETSNISNTTSSQVLSKMEEIRRILVAVQNRIKEILLDIKKMLSATIETFVQEFNQGIASNGAKIQTEFGKSFTQTTQAFETRMNKAVSSSAAKMKTEFTAALAALSYTPKSTKNMFTGPIGANAIYRDVNSRFSGTYSILATELKNVEKEYSQRMLEFSEKNNPMILRNTIFSAVQKENKDIGKLAKRRDKYLDRADKLKKKRMKANEGKKYGDKGYIKPTHEERFKRTQAALIDEEIEIRKEFLTKLKTKMKILENELNALGRTKPLTTPVSESSSAEKSGHVNMSAIPPEYQPNYSVPGGGIIVSPTNIPWGSIPKEYRPNWGKESEHWTNEQKAQREAILAQRKNERQLLKNEAAEKTREKALNDYNKRLNNSFTSPKVGAALNNFFGGSFSEKDLMNSYLNSSKLKFAPTSLTWEEKTPAYASSKTESGHTTVGGAQFPMALAGTKDGYITKGLIEKTIAEIERLNLVLQENTMGLEKLTSVESMRGGRAVYNPYTQTFSSSALREKELYHLNQEVSKITRMGSYKGYALPGYGSGSSAEEAINWAKYRQRNQPTYNYGKMTPIFNEVDSKEMVTQQNQLKQMFGEKLDKQEKNDLKQHALIAQQTTQLAKEKPETIGKNVTKNLTLRNRLMGNMSKGLKGFGGALKSVTSFMGGPFFAVMMGADLVMQAWNSAQEAYSKKIQEATEKLDEMIQKQEDAVNIFYEGKHEEGEKEITGWSEEHPDATAEEKETALLDAYSQIYDNRDQGITKLDENTQQLAIATEEVKRATEALGGDFLNDSDFFSGTGDWSDFWHAQYKNSNYLYSDGEESGSFKFKEQVGAYLYRDLTKESEAGILGSDKYGALYYGNPGSGSYFSDNEILIDKSWQDGDDYPWLKEFSPIIAADIWREGSTEQGLKIALGAHGYRALSDQISSTGGWDDSAWTHHGYNIANYFKSASDQNKLQMGLKNYGKEFSKLGQQTRRFEKATGSTALGAFNKEFGKTKNVRKALENLSVKDPKLVSYIKSLAIDTGMSEQQVLMAAQLQQLQDMQDIANNQVAPQLMSLVATSFDQVAYGGQTLNTVQGAGKGAISAAQNAAAIANLLQVKVEGELGKKVFQEYTENLDDPTQGKYQTPEQLMSAAKKAHDKDVRGELPENERYLLGYYNDYVESYAQVNSRLFNPAGSPAAVQQASDAFMKESEKNRATSASMFNTLRQGLNTGAAQQILAAYDAQLDAQESSGSGGGGGSGSGSGDKDNTGTKKERVDLVLCSKKEIPKLNVNLFKKPPTFTVLNKNFKVRDVKINTEDKPKAIMSSIKNAFIDVQKRSDPKIIQDEDGVYDPNGATEGNPLPSGTAKTRTD